MIRRVDQKYKFRKQNLLAALHENKWIRQGNQKTTDIETKGLWGCEFMYRRFVDSWNHDFMDSWIGKSVDLWFRGFREIHECLKIN